ncbi:ubiquitin carboxyl-terminal hydrolase 7 [Lingula anatina]|uniref:ubiquitinyl hydrolase 1 n=1 Tax=Lingula anatina TaxID=7574 RepID=A0A1S3JR14_LINAN|nr:ubiquitin carboxyl-terminal hydrolase 7 [Lingula anatina]XP_013412848.1 ubiquitin carboxyl-terminal hydrolase 7 [Lingula anatina]|eukprot:XP_013412846.1 ubiquitin carboxyl-terminal hydrolase 7 [Lingula anatina]
MFWIFYSVYTAVYYGSIDFMVFLLVDLVAKTPLKEARDDGEKRLVWLYEALALMFFSVVVYIIDHVPYLLFTLAVLTLLYTQVHGRVDFRDLWIQLTTRWDEFQQHEESMEQMRREQVRQTEGQFMMTSSPIATPPLHMVSQADPFPNVSPIASAAAWNNVDTPGNRFMHPLPPQLRFNSPSGPSVTGMSPQGTVLPSPQQQDPGFPVVSEPFSSGQQFYSRLPTNYAFANMNHNSRFQNQNPSMSARLPTVMPKRLVNKIHTGYGDMDPKVGKTQSGALSRVMNVLGLGKYRTTPPGLRNDSKSICFMNAVLQCLARSPKLPESLGNISQDDIERRKRKASLAETTLLESIKELLHELNVQPDGNSRECPDITRLREAASSLTDLVASPSNQDAQQQQDTAEFLTWLLSTLHQVLNKTGDQGGSQADQFMSPALAMLKFIYGDLNERRIEELKGACRREISIAHGLDNNTYAEPIQRLSDLEWLTYKQANTSPVDDLFSGQLVEAQHCVECNHISVNIQPFNILPVPLVAPRELTGLVYLEDCFTKFGNVEKLYGVNGLRCPCTHTVQEAEKTKPLNLVSHTQQRNVDHDLRRRVISDSVLRSPLNASSLVTPIRGREGSINPLSDSGFHDNNHLKTSTPIGDNVFNFDLNRDRVRLTDGQRRSLLRQLPECLVIQILRFRFDSEVQDACKDSSPLSVPLSGLDLTHIIFDTVANREDLTSGDLGYRYDLYGMCLHVGGQNTNYGHYVAYAQASDGLWYKFDDESVSQISIDYELTTKFVRENAYILFYRRNVTGQ